jgi:hypothetical protein
MLSGMEYRPPAIRCDARAAIVVIGSISAKSYVYGLNVMLELGRWMLSQRRSCEELESGQNQIN